MKTSINWIKDYLDFDLEIDQVSSELTMAGLEVDAIQEIKPSFSGVVTGKIISVSPHPNAESCSVCIVSNGQENLQVVCGAKNIKPGDIVPFAINGARVGEKVISPVRIREVDSFGMLCSEKELEVGFDQSGILILPENTPLGKLLEEIYSLKDTVLEIGITPNRGDCLSVRGIAREIAASFGRKLKYRKLHNYHSHHADIKVSVDDPAYCSVYGGALLSNVTVKPSPFDLRYRLFLSGIRAINNIVDITNFVLLDLGQPMHAFDLARLEGKAIHVRFAKDGEKIQTLDGVVRELSSSHLVIADSLKPLAVAGVMGGEGSGVFDGTKEIFFESACFNPASVRKTSRELGLSSDSSYRFERGVDPEAIPESLLLASRMAEELAGAKVIHSRINLENLHFKKRMVTLRSERCNKVLGLNLKEKEIASILKKIEIRKSAKGEYAIPGYRNDIEKEIDLIEEVARVRGYENIYEHNEKVELKYIQNDPMYAARKRITDRMVSIGLNQVINYSFVSEKDLIQINGFLEKPEHPEKIANPLSPEQSVMRNSLLPGLMTNFVNSSNYKHTDIKLFEVGAIFPGRKGIADKESPQKNRLGFVLGGQVTPSFVGVPGRNFDFFDLKGILEELFKLLNVKPNFGELKEGFFDEGLSILVNGEVVGVLGLISESVLKKYDCKEKLYGAEMDIEGILGSRSGKVKYAPISRLPAITLDFSMLVDMKVTHQDIEQCINELSIPVLEKISIFDIYQGKNIPEGKKSLAYSLTYRDREKTLPLENANRLHEQIKNRLRERLQADFR